MQRLVDKVKKGIDIGSFGYSEKPVTMCMYAVEQVDSRPSEIGTQYYSRPLYKGHGLRLLFIQFIKNNLSKKDKTS